MQLSAPLSTNMPWTQQFFLNTFIQARDQVEMGGKGKYKSVPGHLNNDIQDL